MEFKFLIGLLLAGQFSFPQSIATSLIDTSNYYDKLTHKGSVNWLRISDAIPIIIDELEKDGYSYSNIDIGRLLRIDSSQYFVISVSYSDHFGFVYKQGHGIPFRKSDRFYLTHEDKSEFQYVQDESLNDTSTNYVQIKKLPKNIFILDERCYWYEFDPTGKITFPVSKEIISEILRQDIRSYLKKVANK